MWTRSEVSNVAHRLLEVGDVTCHRTWGPSTLQAMVVSSKIGLQLFPNPTDAPGPS